MTTEDNEITSQHKLLDNLHLNMHERIMKIMENGLKDIRKTMKEEQTVLIQRLILGFNEKTDETDNDSIKDLQGKKTTLEKKNGDLENEKTALEKQNGDLKTENDDLEKKNGDLKQKKKQLYTNGSIVRLVKSRKIYEGKDMFDLLQSMVMHVGVFASMLNALKKDNKLSFQEIIDSIQSDNEIKTYVPHFDDVKTIIGADKWENFKEEFKGIIKCILSCAAQHKMFASLEFILSCVQDLAESTRKEVFEKYKQDHSDSVPRLIDSLKPIIDGSLKPIIDGSDFSPFFEIFKKADDEIDNDKKSVEKGDGTMKKVVKPDKEDGVNDDKKSVEKGDGTTKNGTTPGKEDGVDVSTLLTDLEVNYPQDQLTIKHKKRLSTHLTYFVNKLVNKDDSLNDMMIIHYFESCLVSLVGYLEKSNYKVNAEFSAKLVATFKKGTNFDSISDIFIPFLKTFVMTDE